MTSAQFQAVLPPASPVEQNDARTARASHALACPWEKHLAATRAAERAPVPAAGDRRRHRSWGVLEQPRREHVDGEGKEHRADEDEVPVDDGGRRERVRHAALLPLSLLLPDVPVAHPLEGLDRELGAALAVHLVAQSGGGRLVARLGDGGDERSAQLLWEDRLELGQRPGAEAVRDSEPRVLELVEA